MKRLPALAVVTLFALVVVLIGPLSRSADPSSAVAPASSSGAIGSGRATDARPGKASIDPSGPPDPTAAPPTEPTTQPTPGLTPEPTAAPPTSGPLVDVPIVAVTQFRTTRTATDQAEVAAVLAGRSGRFDAVELVEGEADAILAALGVDRPADPDRLILAGDAATLTRDMAGHRRRLGFLRADAVTPAVRSLAWDGAALFGVDRVRKTGDWALTARLPQAAAGQAFDAAATWTLFAGGDIMLDRGVAETLKIKGKGADFPFDGGRAEITGRTCCSSFGWKVPTTGRTGGAGSVRRLIEGADIAIANFENPAPDRFRYHTRGTVFSADPKLIKGLATAGIDWVGIANNHIRDAGGLGILQTLRNLDRYGIASSGAGKNLAAARRPAILEAGGVKVAMLAYDTIARSYTAGLDRIGSARMTAQVVRADVKRARAAGADVVIVFPHWGTEYDPTPFPAQRKLAQAAIDAGADMIIGNHAHWASALEVYEGKPIWYALGNLVFDQTWSEPTMEGITLELTFRGADLVQARIRPHIILDKAQPNFLDPAGSGRVVMSRVFDASRGLLPW